MANSLFKFFIQINFF